MAEECTCPACEKAYDAALEECVWLQCPSCGRQTYHKASGVCCSPWPGHINVAPSSCADPSNANDGVAEHWVSALCRAPPLARELQRMLPTDPHASLIAPQECVSTWLKRCGWRTGMAGKAGVAHRDGREGRGVHKGTGAFPCPRGGLLPETTKLCKQSIKYSNPGARTPLLHDPRGSRNLQNTTNTNTDTRARHQYMSSPTL
jgi:hypothetical protein